MASSDDPLGLDALRKISKQTAVTHRSDLVVHKRLPNRLKAQILLSTPHENAEFIEQRETLESSTSTCKPLLILRDLVNNESSRPLSKRVSLPERRMDNLIDQLIKSVNDLSPRSVAEVICSLCILQPNTSDERFLPFINRLINRSDLSSLSIAILGLHSAGRGGLISPLTRLLSQNLRDTTDLVNTLTFEEARTLALVHSRSGLKLTQLVARDIVNVLKEGIDSVLDPRKLLPIPVAILRLDVDSDIKVKALMKIANRFDTMLTSRQPFKVIDGIEGWSGLQSAYENLLSNKNGLLKNVAVRLRLHVKGLIEDERLNAGDYKAQLAQRRIDARFYDRLVSSE